MKHCKRILLLVVVMVILIAGLSCTAFASETGAEDWRIEGNSVTLYPGLEFSTQNTDLIPSWADRISEVDKNVFESFYFDKANKLLYLKVNEKFTSNTKTQFKLRGIGGIAYKTVTVYVNVGPKYLPNLTLLQGEARMATLPYGVKSVEIMEGSENVCVAKKGDSVLVQGKKEGTARVSVQYYADDIRNSVEAYEFKVGVIAKANIDISDPKKYFSDKVIIQEVLPGLIKRLPLELLGFAQDTPLDIREYGLEVGEDFDPGNHSYTYLNLEKDIPVGTTCEVSVPMNVWKGINKGQEPVVYFLHNGFETGYKYTLQSDQALLVGESVFRDDNPAKVLVAYEDVYKPYIEVETPVMQRFAYEYCRDCSVYDKNMSKFYFLRFKDNVPDNTHVTVSVFTGGKAKQYDVEKINQVKVHAAWLDGGPAMDKKVDYGYNVHLNSRRIVKSLRYGYSDYDQKSRFIFDPYMMRLYDDQTNEYLSFVRVEGLLLGKTTVYESIKAGSNVFWRLDAEVTMGIEDTGNRLMPGDVFSYVPLQHIKLENYIGTIEKASDLRIEKKYLEGTKEVVFKWDQPSKGLSVSMPGSVKCDYATVDVTFTNVRTKMSCKKRFYFHADDRDGRPCGIHGIH